MVSTFPLASTVNLKNVRLAIRALQPQLVEWRRQIHQKPESFIHCAPFGFSKTINGALYVFIQCTVDFRPPKFSW